jgi:predicted Zn-dependent protease
MKRKFAVAPDLPPDINMILGKKFIDQYEVLRYNDRFLPIRLTPLSEKRIAEVRDVSEMVRKTNEEKEAQDAERERLRREKYREDTKKRLDGA